MPSDLRGLRLLAAMACPDDAEILAGGTLFLVKALGWELVILMITAGVVPPTRPRGRRQQGLATPRGGHRRTS